MMTESKKINVLRLTAVHYQHPDLQKAKIFFEDFGFVEAQRDDSHIYFRGFGIEPYIYIAEQAPTTKRAFVRGVWTVASREDLDTAAAHPTALTPIEQDKGPGGGEIVTLRDLNGVAISFVYGKTLRERDNRTIVSRNLNNAEVNPNLAFEKHRRGQNRRFDLGPCPVHKIGHYGFGISASKFEKTVSWYTSLMNLKLTDAVFNPATGKDVTSFFHIDLGTEFSDHHSIFFVTDPGDKPAYIHHSSFEVNDIDSQSLGHDWLASKNWTNCWGVGRHILGSQIFDYWFDSSGNIVEHYCDGDMVNAKTPVEREPQSPHSMHIWGPDVPLAFMTGKVEDVGQLFSTFIKNAVPSTPTALEGSANG